MNKYKILSVMLILSFLLCANSMSVTASNTLPLNTELDIALTQFTPYNNDYKVQDDLISGTSLNLSEMPIGFKLNKEHTLLNLESITVESDESILSGSDYSKTFINNTVNAVVESGCGGFSGCTTEVVAVTGGSADTVMTGTVHGNGTASTATYTSNVYWDSNDDGDFVDTGDRAYFPLSSTTVYFLVQILADQNATSTTDYASIKLVFETAGSDFNVEIRSYMGAGDSGWSFSGNDATFKAYDADNTGVSVIVPLDEIISDASASVTLKGLNKIQYIFYIDEANNQIALTSHNVAVFENYPSLTDRVDDDNDRDYNENTGHVFANEWDDTDYLQTKITEGGTEAYDNTMPLLADIDGDTELNHNFRYLKFTGHASIDPVSSNNLASSTYVSVNKYLTTETLSFDTRAINNFDTFSNVMTFSAIKLNVTIDDDTLYDSVDYEDNLVSFTVDGISFFNVFKSAWSASGVVDNTEIQYDITDFSTSTGSLQSVVLQYYTDESWTVTGIVTSTTTTSVVGGVAVADTGMSNEDILLWIGVILLITITATYVVRRKDKKGSK